MNTVTIKALRRGYHVRAIQQLFGLRDKPITQKDALPNSQAPAEILARTGPIVSIEVSPLASCQGKLSKQSIDRFEAIAIAIDSDATTF
ncbi:hypothetical protein V6N12_065285 [Hibiscus sabdariffa]|uniref:Uncharacterized protein n=1 Tax=Hibiscus sabdariffa TaxID=183260 RepID=A0ABR2G895_9ROSI